MAVTRRLLKFPFSARSRVTILRNPRLLLRLVNPIMLPTAAKKRPSAASGSLGHLCCAQLFRWRRRGLLALLGLAMCGFLAVQYAVMTTRLGLALPNVLGTSIRADATADAITDLHRFRRTERGRQRGTAAPTEPMADELWVTARAAGDTPAPHFTQEQRRLAVKEAMRFAWGNYERHAFGADEVGPVKGDRRQDVWGDIACSLVDGLDTLWIMDLKDEFKRARDYVASALRFDHLGGKGDKISVFETIIREVGGLLSAFSLSRDDVFKNKAQELMDLLVPAYEASEGVFYTYLNPQTREKGFASWANYRAYIADIGSLQLETRYLSDITGNTTYAEMGEAFYSILKREGAFNGTGLFPVKFDSKTGKFSKGSSSISIGAYGDSFYEYLLKVFIYSGKRDEDKFLRAFYDDAVRGMEEHLLQYSEPDKLYYLQEVHVPSMSGVPRMDHLLCFVPGMLALGTLHEKVDTEKNARHLELAKKIAHTCYQMYHQQPTGLSPDIVRFPGMHIQDAKYRLRPETIESLFYLYRVTKDEMYRDLGWEIFQSLEKNAKVAFGYGAIENVAEMPPKVENKMESFFLAETLKYHYLLQAPPDVIPLDEYVFNTEAHPLRILKS